MDTRTHETPEPQTTEVDESLVPQPLGPVSQLTGGECWGGGDWDNIVWGNLA